MMRILAGTLLAAALLVAGAHDALAGDKHKHAASEAFHPSRAPVPPFECKARVGYDRDMVLPGYILPTAAGPRTCVPFTSARFKPPKDYRGDYYVAEFTDAKLRKRWRECEEEKECHKRVYDQVLKRHPPNREYNLSDPHGRFLLGKLDEKGADTDLTTVRRPGFFARAPYNEPIAELDGRTYVVEFTTVLEPYEVLRKHMTGDVKLRGWYLRGAGVDDGKGGKVRALIVMSGGGGDRVTAIDDPVDKAYVIDPKTGETLPNDDWPNATTGVKGEAVWREMWRRLNAAGFDVLAMDRRGVGVSGGFSDTNTLQQGRDLLRVVGELRSGQGMRALGPDGKLLLGREAAAAVRGAAPDGGLPVMFMGSSRGTMASGWAMTQNFDKDCGYDMPKITCAPAHRDPHVKGAILVAEFSSGVGYLPAETSPKDDGRGPGRDRGLFIGGIEEENNIVFFPSSAILAGVGKWPSAFFARGLWCYADGLEGSMDSYSRVHGSLKELVVVRGPHPYETGPADAKRRVQDRIIAYGRAVVLGEHAIPGGRRWSDMKTLVATAGDTWEPSTQPTVVPGP
jgi:pimeloyl-ACP methyl ester carboxylesterase